jgi:hypothetical protein
MIAKSTGKGVTSLANYSKLPLNPYDGTNFTMFNSLQSSYPLMFYRDILVQQGCTVSGRDTQKCYATPTIQYLNINILGTASPEAIADQNYSIELCSSIFLGNPNLVQFFIGIAYDTAPAIMFPYMRPAGSTDLCMPSIISKYETAGYVQEESHDNQIWNLTNCTRRITPELLMYIPYISRNYIIEWIYGRSMRYMLFTKEHLSPTAAKYTATGSGTLRKLSLPNPNGVDFTSYLILDSIAQQFYTTLGGNFAMTYIYDALPVGKTIIDVRFDLTIHNGPSTLLGAAMVDLKAQYTALMKSRKLPEDAINQARADYQAKLPQQQISQINDTVPPIQGTVARLYYTVNTPLTNPPTITITGMIFDPRAVTSFVSELNGGLLSPMGDADGNENYQPTVIYTLNKTETLNCSDPATINRMIYDYRDNVEANP